MRSRELDYVNCDYECLRFFVSFEFYIFFHKFMNNFLSLLLILSFVRVKKKYVGKTESDKMLKNYSSSIWNSAQGRARTGVNTKLTGGTVMRVSSELPLDNSNVESKKGENPYGETIVLDPAVSDSQKQLVYFIK